MNWLNIYPLIKDAEFLKLTEDQELMSLWIPANRIGVITFGKMNRGQNAGKHFIEIIFNDAAKAFMQAFDTFEEAEETWLSLQMSLGIKVPKKRGPKPKFFEDLRKDL